MTNKKDCCNRNDGSEGISISRRELLAGIGGTSALMAMGLPVMAGPFGADKAAGEGPIPLDKKLASDWIAALYARGKPTIYTGWPQLQYIGMPIGGIGTGTVYMGGDGKLWCWDIFNEHHQGVVPYRPGFRDPGLKSNAGGQLSPTSGLNYVSPPAQESPWHFDQGFALLVGAGERPAVHMLDQTGFKEIEFKGQYPVAEVAYRDPDVPVTVDLEAFSPFIPLDTDRSSYPATILRYRVTNHSSTAQTVALDGWIGNPALMNTSKHRGDARRVNRTLDFEQGVGVHTFSESLDNNRSLPDYEDADTLPDFGSLCLLCLDSKAFRTAREYQVGVSVDPIDEYSPNLFAPEIAGISSSIELQPGDSHEFTYILAWHFPNARIETNVWSTEKPVATVSTERRWYAGRFADARAVALDVVNNLEELTRLTRLWRNTWYDSSLPHWLLERSLIPVNALQTNTAYRFENGRFWAWEGVGCCAGTCTHVWHYAQSVGRLFPDLERDLRERTDYGIGFQDDDGAIHFRGEFNDGPATDGQAGVILRTYREHQMSTDDAFLQRVWPKARKALEFLIAQDARDGAPDGIPVGEQHNTLDAEWFGKIPVLASLYMAALRAGEEMAGVVGDTDFAEHCRAIHAKGQASILELFDARIGFFIQEEDPEHLDAIGVGKGCYIDQVMGQWWAYQLGLGRIYDGKSMRRALSSLWDHNFCPDVGLFRDSIDNPKLRGRPYALAGDAGLVMCTWPAGGKRDDWEKHWQYGYFNECMTGFEYEVAGHMIWESDQQPDLLEKGLAITRAIHDRYHASMRNPFNEVECSDHYARAMASYGVFLACSGFEYDGPKGHLGFKPRLTDQGRFKAAFTSAQGWGSYQQNQDSLELTATLSLHYGQLQLSTFATRFDGEITQATINGEPASVETNADGVLLTLPEPMTLKAGDELQIRIA